MNIFFVTSSKNDRTNEAFPRGGEVVKCLDLRDACAPMQISLNVIDTGNCLPVVTVNVHQFTKGTPDTFLYHAA
jgi:hypothetical protein